MEPVTDSQAEAESEEQRNENEDENLLTKAQELMLKITSSSSRPSPKVLHALASMLETQESRYIEELGHISPNIGRSTHNIGRLGNLIRDNDEFFELISSEFLSATRYSTSVRSAAARLLLCCSTTWMYPYVFEDTVLENLKNWVMDDNVRSADGYNGKHDLGRNEPTDLEMLRTYATGLLAVCLTGGGQLVEDVLTSGLPAKLMHYLRTRVLGETNTSQKDASFQTEGKNASGATCMRGREENRGRFRQVLDVNHLGGLGIGDEDNHCFERDQDKSISNRQIRGEECQGDVGELLKSREVADDLVERVGMCGVDEDDVEEIGEDRWHRELHEGMAKFGDGYGTSRFLRDADVDENERDDLSRHKVNRGWAKTRGKGKVNEVVVETERVLVSPGSGLRLGAQGRSMRERNLEMKRLADAKKYSNRTDDDAFLTERDSNDDCFQECKVGTRDISDLVKRAIKAAEAEARAASAPAEAIKAAGDAAADLVKTVALEALKLTNDEEAAVLAASEAASTVVDAANATEVSRSSSNVNEDTMTSKAIESETDDEIEGFFLLDYSSLAQLREKYCIQCLEVLGEYVEVLGPVLNEKGVDVCLSLLQQNSKQKEVSKDMILLSDVLKLICALAAHRKFAALFVDRGGMQKLLAVPRVAHTFFGLSSCLFTICSLPGIMERTCALPSDVVRQLVELALELLECPQDLARKNAAVFFATAFLFRVVVDSFDAQEGLKKSLSLLQGAASVRSGGNSGISNLGSLQNDGSPAEVLTLSEKQVAFHTCIALRQYFRAHLLLLVESLRPNKKASSVGRNVQNARAAYKPLDISNEAIDAVLIHIQRDRKLGTAFVRARWPAVDKFLGSNGHITMLELCQAPPVERYLHDLAQYALGVLQIVTLVPYSRKLIVNATLSNDRLGMAVILDAANGAGYVDSEVIQPALNVLVNLVCPPPSISNKPSAITQGQQSVSVQTSNGPGVETRERLPERNISDRAVSLSIQNESRERNGESCADSSVVLGTSSVTSCSQTAVPTITSGVVGDRRISLGPGAGCAGLAAQLEQGYHQAREAVRANNGIKVLLHLLHPRIPTPPTALDCVRALACRVLLGLARDDTIAHILTKLQVGKKLSELIRDSGGQTHGIEQGRWQSELSQVAIELIAIVTNSGRASTLAATDAAAPTLRRIERAAIAAATPITYHSKELLLLIHEHLLASGLPTTAASLLKESRLTPLPSLAAPPPLLHQTSVQETLLMQSHWPSGRAPRGFLSDSSNPASRDDHYGLKSDLAASSKKKPLAFSPSLSFQLRNQSASHPSPVNKISGASGNPSISAGVSGTPVVSELKSNSDSDSQLKTPMVFPLKRKITELKDPGFPSPKKRLTTGEHMFRSPVCQTPRTVCKSSLPVDSVGRSNPSGGILSDNLDDSLYNSAPAGQMIPSPFQFGLQAELQHSNPERVTLDSLVVQYLKHQHRQCPAPITTLPPLPLLQPHTCPEAKRSLDLPANVTSRMGTREFRNQYGGIHGNRRDRQFVYSRFKPWRTCRDDAALLTCIAFLGDASRIVTGSHNGELKIFDTNSCNVLESHTGHQSPVTLVQSALSGGTQLLLTSGSYDVQLWDASSIASGPLHSFEGKGGRLSNSCTTFAALSRESSRREVLLYDIQTYNLELKLSDTSTSPLVNNRGHVQSLIHFSPSDTMILWNGVLWDRRGSGPIHRFDQFTDYGGGGFHPAGNEVIINSEVWDLRKFKLLRTVPSLDQTVIKFNASGDVIYAILRRNLEDITSAVNTRRVRHPLFSAFRTVDAVNYYDIATIPATVPVDRCVLDFATEPTDSVVGLVSMDDHEEMFASARLYEIGRRRPTDDDSDPDDDAQSEEDDEEDDSEADEDQIFGTDLDGDMDSIADDMSNDDEDGDDSGDEFDDDDGDADFGMDGVDFDGDAGMLEIATEGDGDDDSQVVESESSGDEGDFVVNGFGF